MKATKVFNQYSLQVFGNKMSKEDFRALQAGKDVKVDPQLVKLYPECFENTGNKKPVKEVNNGS